MYLFIISSMCLSSSMSKHMKFVRMVKFNEKEYFQQLTLEVL